MGNCIKAVIFDLGRVIIDFDHWIAAKKIFSLSKKAPQDIFDFFFNSKLTQKFECGKISPEHFFRRVKRELGLKVRYKEFLPIWNEIFFLTEENNKVYDIASCLKGKYKIALLSNVNELHLGYVKKNFPVFDVFDYIFASCEIGFMKPDHRIYTRALKQLGSLPKETFYVDDRQDLIKEARKLGIKAFVYEGAEKLKQDLLYCGIE